MHSYYESRKNAQHAEHRQEAHYNMARVYHMLGLVHLAIPYYVSVLGEISEGSSRSLREDLIVDTAYNLQIIYSMAGNTKLANEVSRKWLRLM